MHGKSALFVVSLVTLTLTLPALGGTIGVGDIDVPPITEDFERYAPYVGPDWVPDPAVDGWGPGIDSSGRERTYLGSYFNGPDYSDIEIGNFGVNSETTTDMALRVTNRDKPSNSIHLTWYGSLNETIYRQQFLSVDFFPEATGTRGGPPAPQWDLPQRFTFGTWRGTGSSDLVQMIHFGDGTPDAPVTGRILGGHNLPGPESDIFPIPDNDITVGEFLNIWWSLDFEWDLARDQTIDASVFNGDYVGRKGQVRARLRRQDSSVVYDWTPWVNLGGLTSPPPNGSFNDEAPVIGYRPLFDGRVTTDNIILTGDRVCDIDDSGDCDAADIDILTAGVRNGTSNAYLDINRMGDRDIPDQADYEFMITDPELIGSGFGDADLNKLVNFADFAALSNNFGMTGTGWAAGNFNTDDITNFADFAALSNNFGVDFTSGSDVPEPAAIGVLGVLAMALLRKRQ